MGATFTRRLILAIAAMAILAGGADAREDGKKPKKPKDDYYTNVDGARVHRPGPAPKGYRKPTALCRDGQPSYSLHRRGTCSHHGGVAIWY